MATTPIAALHLDVARILAGDPDAYLAARRTYTAAPASPELADAWDAVLDAELARLAAEDVAR